MTCFNNYTGLQRYRMNEAYAKGQRAYVVYDNNYEKYAFNVYVDGNRIGSYNSRYEAQQAAKQYN